MTVYFLVEILQVTDEGQYNRYIDAVRSIVENHGGEYVLRSSHVTLASGSDKPERIILIRFPNEKAITECFSSPEYISIAPLRECSTKSRAYIIQDNG